MNNEEFINYYKNTYTSLKYFTIKDNRLILSLDTTYIIPFNHIYFSQLNSLIFALDPIELFQTLYLLELFYKQDLEPQEINFITSYVNKYIRLNDSLLSNERSDNTRINALSIPIYTSYNEEYQNTACSMLIQNILNNHQEELEKGSSKGTKLVLSNPHFKGTMEEEEDYKYLEKAGYTVIFLITSAVIATALYIAFFMASH